MAAGAAPGDDGRRQAGRYQRGDDRAHPIGLDPDEPCPFGKRADLLEIAPIGLDAGIVQRRCGRDLARQRHRIGDIEAAGAAHAHVHIDHDLQSPSGRPRHARELSDGGRMIGDDRDIGAAQKKPAETHQRIGRGQGRGDQYAADPAQGHRLGLADGRTGDADRPGGRDPLSDLHAFMGLGVGAQLDPQGRGTFAHHGDIAIEDVDVDEERGRGDI
jgi:hypothetical protein